MNPQTISREKEQIRQAVDALPFQKTRWTIQYRKDKANTPYYVFTVGRHNPGANRAAPLPYEDYERVCAACNALGLSCGVKVINHL